MCLRCAVSWTGVARCSSVKERNLVEKDREKMYVILNKQSTFQKMNKIELYCLLLCIVNVKLVPKIHLNLKKLKTVTLVLSV